MSELGGPCPVLRRVLDAGIDGGVLAAVRVTGLSCHTLDRMCAELIDYAVTVLRLAGKPFVVDAVREDGQVVDAAESTDPSVPIFAQIVAAQQGGDHDRSST